VPEISIVGRKGLLYLRKGAAINPMNEGGKEGSAEACSLGVGHLDVDGVLNPLRGFIRQLDVLTKLLGCFIECLQ